MRVLREFAIDAVRFAHRILRWLDGFVGCGKPQAHRIIRVWRAGDDVLRVFRDSDRRIRSASRPQVILASCSLSMSKEECSYRVSSWIYVNAFTN